MRWLDLRRVVPTMKCDPLLPSLCKNRNVVLTKLCHNLQEVSQSWLGKLPAAHIKLWQLQMAKLTLDGVSRGECAFRWSASPISCHLFSKASLTCRPWWKLWLMQLENNANVGGKPPKWMAYNGKPYEKGWFGGTIIFGNTQMEYVGVFKNVNP